MLKNKTVVVGLSGGVDSSVTAALLKAQGYDVHGLFMKNWEEDDTLTYCSAESDLNDVKSICKTLDIPIHTVNFSHEYWEKVFSLFLEEYQANRTPNPDILCNKEIKFKAFLDHALKLGADYIATGHYAQCFFNDKTNQYQLCRGLDNNKDQSYFLYTLSQHVLDKVLFPVGHLPKTNVRALAQEYNLITHDKKDSTGICFIGERKFKTFLKEFVLTKPGKIQTPSGEHLGNHDGLLYYTLGQRQGLYIGGKKGFEEKPWYVVGKNLAQNALIVTQDLLHPWHFSTELIANDIHWVSGCAPSSSLRATAKVRYRQSDQLCDIHIVENNTVRVIFDEPQRAVTPGQSVVFYQDNVCLGGGIISETNSPGGLLSLKSVREKNVA